ncbi:MAG: hypothetical protein ACJ74W_10335 [Pyrinomonadaceae bacterium]
MARRIPNYAQPGNIATARCIPNYGQPVMTAAPRLATGRRIPRYTAAPQMSADGTATATATAPAAPPVEVNKPRRIPRYGPLEETDQQLGNPTTAEREDLLHPNGQGIESDNPPPGFAQMAYQSALTSPVEDENGRARSALHMFAEGAARGAQSGSAPFALGSGISSAIGALIHPQADEEVKQERRIPKLKAAADAEAQQTKLAREEADAETERALKTAQTDWYKQRPAIEQNKTDARTRKDAQAAVRADLKNHPHPFSPTSADDAAFLHRAADAGVYLDVDNWGRGGKNDRAVTYVDPDDPTRTINGHYNTFTGEVSPLTLDGQPVQKGYVPPIHPDTQMTSVQEDASKDRKAGQTEQHRHNVVGESQGGAARCARRGAHRHRARQSSSARTADGDSDERTPRPCVGVGPQTRRRKEQGRAPAETK